MKLNYKRTIFVGFAFFLICSFWQAYDNTIPLILTNKFGMSQAWSGVIMALDNVLALFMLPLFGAISDKHRGKRGRRTPFIVVGTLIAAVMLIALSFVDNAQLRHLSDVSAIDDPAALEQIYDRQANETLLTPSGDKFVLSQKFTQEEFIRIRSQVEQDGKTVTNPDYTNYVVPARQACAWDATAKSPATLVFFIVLLLIVLVSMAVFRSPAVALMPDVTLKPLRSKANARHQPHGLCRRHSGSGSGHGVRHLRRPQLPDELHRLFRRHCGHHAGGAGDFHAHRPGKGVGLRNAAAGRGPGH